MKQVFEWKFQTNYKWIKKWLTWAYYFAPHPPLRKQSYHHPLIMAPNKKIKVISHINVVRNQLGKQKQQTFPK